MDKQKLRFLTFGIILLGTAAMMTPFSGASGCAGSTEEGGGGEVVITITDFTFIPLEFNAHAGETIAVLNEDSEVHTVTSESAPDAFDVSGDFDTGLLNSGDAGAIAIPADASPGDQFFFYCDVHEENMATPNGTITIVE